MKYLILFLFCLSTHASTEGIKAKGYEWRGNLYISINGMVDATMREQLESILTTVTPEVREIFIDLHSPGGDVPEGLRIIKDLQELKRRNLKITATVRNGDMCASMCVPIYAQADLRRAGPASSFMFHSVHTRILGIIGITDKKQNKKSLFDSLESAGVSHDWLDHLKQEGVFDSPQGYWVSGEALVSEKSGLIHELLPRLTPAPSLEIGGIKFWF